MQPAAAVVVLLPLRLRRRVVAIAGCAADAAGTRHCRLQLLLLQQWQRLGSGGVRRGGCPRAGQSRDLALPGGLLLLRLRAVAAAAHVVRGVPSAAAALARRGRRRVAGHCSTQAHMITT